MAMLSIISRPPGMMPAAMIFATQSAPASTVGIPNKIPRAVWAFCRMRTVTSVITPSNPSDPSSAPSDHRAPN